MKLTYDYFVKPKLKMLIFIQMFFVAITLLTQNTLWEILFLSSIPTVGATIAFFAIYFGETRPMIRKIGKEIKFEKKYKHIYKKFTNVN